MKKRRVIYANFAPPGFRFYRVHTPTVFKEVLLPDAQSKMTALHMRRYVELSKLASQHGTTVHSSPYRCS
jgi:hypothetical protein